MFLVLKVNLRILTNKLLRWRSKNIGNKTFLIITSVIIGIVTGLSAVLLKQLVHFIQWLLQFNADKQSQNYFFLIYPLIGVLISVFLIRLIVKKKFYKGISSIIFSIFKRSSIIDRHLTYMHIPTSAFTVGFGGSVGLEAPIVATGSAIGSNIARSLRMGYKERTLLLGCGAAAGIAAIFNSPIAGVLFAFEVLLFEFSVPAFIPLLIASATASIVSKMLFSGQLFFLVTEGWVMKAIPFYILLGLLCGLVSAYIIRMNYKIEDFFKKYKRPYLKAIIGSLILGLLIFIFPPLFGEGYHTIENLLNGSFNKLFNNSLFFGYSSSPIIVILFVAGIILVKIFATAITIGSGGNGGIFAPSLFTGAITGFGFAFLVNYIGIIHLNIVNFIVAGMAGILSGVIHVPLTAIFLIAEITGGYVLFVPLMIVSAISFFVTKYFEQYSVYTKILAEKGIVNLNDKENTLLSKLDINKLIETEYTSVRFDMKFRLFIKEIVLSKKNTFPVLDEEGHLLGIVRLDEIRSQMFNTSLYDSLTVEDVMTEPLEYIYLNENIQLILEKFEKTDTRNLPVIEDGKYVGFISKSKLLDEYRTLFVKQSKELI